jgi:hypothetical protein
MVVAVMSARLIACDLKIETVNAWREYVRKADERMQTRLEGKVPFLWLDESAGRRQRAGQGEAVIAPVVSDGTVRVPGGLIHHWIGGMFIPHTTIQAVSAVTHDYSRYKEFYSPTVVDSRLISCTTTEQKFSMIWQTKVLLLYAAMKGEYQVREVRIDPHRGFSISDTLEIREIENYGKPEEKLLPAGTGNGFIWGLHGISRYEERDGGVYLEREALALTRDIPFSLRWVAGSIISRLSMTSLATTLRQTRDAVAAMPAVTDVATSCANRPSH